jgi:hypothetical protein
LNVRDNHVLYLKVNNHFFDILEDLEIADPPDLTDMDPLEEPGSTELGALL